MKVPKTLGRLEYVRTIFSGANLINSPPLSTRLYSYARVSVVPRAVTRYSNNFYTHSVRGKRLKFPRTFSART